MVDIHCHIVPGVDDGAKDLEMSLAMLEKAREVGLTHILTTPHIRGEKDGLSVHDFHKARFELLQQKAEGIEVILGGEVRVTSESYQVVDQREFTSGEQGKYILLELPHDHVPKYLGELLFAYRLRGVTPIIAHPERNIGIIEHLETALTLVEQGAHLQLTNGSVTGELGQVFEQVSWKLLEAGLISFVASDAHNLTSRTFDNWTSTYDRLQNALGTPVADSLTTTNPRSVCLSEPLPQPDGLSRPRESVLKTLANPSKLSQMKRKRYFFF